MQSPPNVTCFNGLFLVRVLKEHCLGQVLHTLVGLFLVRVLKEHCLGLSHHTLVLSDGTII
jgi:hypothetical protein